MTVRANYTAVVTVHHPSGRATREVARECGYGRFALLHHDSRVIRFAVRATDGWHVYLPKEAAR